jgi:hypothetical protein
MLGSRTHNLKSARLVAKRRKILVGKLLITLVSVGLIWWLLFYVSHLKTFLIDNVEVSGNVTLSQTEIQGLASGFLTGDYFFTFPKSGIFFYPKKEIADRIINTYPVIKDLDIKFKSFHEISILINERKVEYLFCQNDLEVSGKQEKSESCYALDSSGFNFAKYSEVSTTTSSFIKFYPKDNIDNPVGKNYFSEIFFSKLAVFVKALSDNGMQLSRISEKTPVDFEGLFEKGQRVLFSRDTDLIKAIDNLKTIIESKEFGGPQAFQKIDYIDMRFGNKIFYKSK